MSDYISFKLYKPDIENFLHTLDVPPIINFASYGLYMYIKILKHTHCSVMDSQSKENILYRKLGGAHLVTSQISENPLNSC